LRAGRFDLKIYIPLPDIEQRKGILKKILSKKIGELNNVD
jgi:SpoVK/Ycf46/Vps4 family AAA+-type ATPase